MSVPYLMPGVNNLDAKLLCSNYDGGDVAPRQGEDVPHTVRLQHLGHQLPAVTPAVLLHLIMKGLVPIISRKQ